MCDERDRRNENHVPNDNELFEQCDPLNWRDHVVEILGASSGLGARLVKTIYAEPYFGRTAGMWGYSFCFEYPRSTFSPDRGFIMLSRTHLARSEQEARSLQPSLEMLLKELTHQVRCFPKEAFGMYHPELDVPGYYGTIECLSETRSRFYYMISQSGRMKPYSRFKRLFHRMPV